MPDWYPHKPPPRRNNPLALAVLYIMLILVPAGIGGCYGATYYWWSRRSRARTALNDTPEKAQRRFYYGAVAGGIVGIVAAVVLTLKAKEDES